MALASISSRLLSQRANSSMIDSRISWACRFIIGTSLVAHWHCRIGLEPHVGQLPKGRRRFPRPCWRIPEDATKVRAELALGGMWLHTSSRTERIAAIVLLSNLFIAGPLSRPSINSIRAHHPFLSAVRLNEIFSPTGTIPCARDASRECLVALPQDRSQADRRVSSRPGPTALRACCPPTSQSAAVSEVSRHDRPGWAGRLLILACWYRAFQRLQERAAPNPRWHSRIRPAAQMHSGCSRGKAPHSIRPIRLTSECLRSALIRDRRPAIRTDKTQNPNLKTYSTSHYYHATITVSNNRPLQTHRVRTGRCGLADRFL
jgi:hypothetical protein